MKINHPRRRKNKKVSIFIYLVFITVIMHSCSCERNLSEKVINSKDDSVTILVEGVTIVDSSLFLELKFVNLDSGTIYIPKEYLVLKLFFDGEGGKTIKL